MFTKAFVLLLASSAIAAPIDRRGKPVGWATDYLEDYDTYHARYLALDCQDQHNTTFYDDCCHPLLATENLQDDRPAYCTPNATVSSSAVEYEATATVSASADNDAASQYCKAKTSQTSSVVVASSAVPTSAVDSTTAAPAVTSFAAESSAAVSTDDVAPISSAAAASSIVAEANYAHAHGSGAASSSTDDWSAPSSTSSAAAAASSTASSSGGSSSQVQTGGYATYFYQGGQAGACGITHSDSDKVIAIDAAGWWPDYLTNDNSPYCGKYITITNTNNNQKVTAMVADVCPTCSTDNSLDLSVGAFTAIASESDGMVPIEWSWA